MSSAPGFETERARTAALAQCQILDTPADGVFDGLVALAARRFRTPIVLISLVDEPRLRFKAAHGQTARTTPRE